MLKENKPVKIKNDGYKNKNLYVKEKRKESPDSPDSMDMDMPVNEYHLDTAYKIKWAKWVTTAFLIVFIICGVLFGELSADNFNYLLRYINIQGSNVAAKTEFYIELDETSSVCYYKNNIAALKKNGLAIYDMSGRRNFTHRLVYSNPVLKTSDRYIIAYDINSNKMEIFNAFSRVYEYKGDRPIYGAEVTDNGNVVYISSEKIYKSAVYVMDSGFSKIFGYGFGEDYIVSADINEKSDKPDKLVAAGFSVQNGDYISRITLFDTHLESNQIINSTEITGELPFGVKFNENGIFAAFENSFRFYDLNGNAVSSYDFARGKIKTASLTRQLAAVVLNEELIGTDDRILIFDGNGDILYENAFGEEIRDIKFSEDYKFLYYLTRTGLYKINIGQKTFGFVTNEYDETADNIIYATGRKIYLSGLLKINAINTDETD